jgi:hypothetical protein
MYMYMAFSVFMVPLSADSAQNTRCANQLGLLEGVATTIWVNGTAGRATENVE